MVEFAKVMDYPIAVTEQYSRGLGKTIPELEAAHEFVLSDKTQFSMFTPEVNEFMEKHQPRFDRQLSIVFRWKLFSVMFLFVGLKHMHVSSALFKI